MKNGGKQLFNDYITTFNKLAKNDKDAHQHKEIAVQLGGKKKTK